MNSTSEIKYLDAGEAEQRNSQPTTWPSKLKAVTWAPKSSRKDAQLGQEMQRSEMQTHCTRQETLGLLVRKAKPGWLSLTSPKRPAGVSAS